ncbi:DUF2252 domain-containing protein [Conexibacter stalactiti]|uniref:DUF2252 domain-containing protein n=1 Tax=Conexibacter stalactiti TaxID=1940611 RepID=A0ABU4HYV7_9ACTN|nr:DUF2252 domain-containing protein [Conexibacter stalactiti]MDW5598408.1 DUF2252 domain-containing protein [Conexibacter stalactiti]MEC5039050.1 DUF2252 domain-containing protein [Conexibacter stalactiti]
MVTAAPTQTAAGPSPPGADERAARGRAARAEVPRRAHGAWSAPADRRSPLELLEQQAQTRVPELVPIRYGRMLVSPFTFYRGAAYVMAADLAGLPRTNLDTQLCGDAHLSNFGVYAAPDRDLVFDVNDFDETLPGPFEWDVKRLVTSFAVAGRDRGFDAAQRTVVNRAVSRAYREAIHRYAAMSELDLWYSRISLDALMRQIAAVASAKQLKRAEKNIAKARSKDSVRALAKLTETVDGQLRIRSAPPVVVATRDLFAPAQQAEVDDAIARMLRSYRETLPYDRRRLLERYRYVDAARKVVGVGSVGTRAWIVLLLGRRGDPLFLQLKEAEASVLEPFLGASEFGNHGERVVEGQRLTQAANDITLGWLRVTGVDGREHDYYVRQLWDAKGSALVELMDPRALEEYAKVCGEALARAHARAGDALPIAHYLGRSDAFDRALATFAEAYADQNEQDYATMRAAVEAGTIAVRTGV